MRGVWLFCWDQNVTIWWLLEGKSFLWFVPSFLSQNQDWYFDVSLHRTMECHDNALEKRARHDCVRRNHNVDFVDSLELEKSFHHGLWFSSPELWYNWKHLDALDMNLPLILYFFNVSFTYNLIFIIHSHLHVVKFACMQINWPLAFSTNISLIPER